MKRKIRRTLQLLLGLLLAASEWRLKKRLFIDLNTSSCKQVHVMHPTNLFAWNIAIVLSKAELENISKS